MLLHIARWLMLAQVLTNNGYLALTTNSRESPHISNARVRRSGAPLFPPRSGMGMFLALSVPVDLPRYELSLSYNFEANYVLPSNLTELEIGPQITQIRFARSITRSRVYNVVEERLNSEGVEGRTCLLKTICQTAAVPVHGHNGLLGDLIHLIFTPSASEPEDIANEYSQAELIGREQGETGCTEFYTKCSLNIYQLFSVWDQ